MATEPSLAEISLDEPEEMPFVIDMVEAGAESGNLTRFSRSCEICSADNPLRRAFFAECGHILCLACATHLADEKGVQDCPFCRKSTKFTTLVETVVNDDGKSCFRRLKEKCSSAIHSAWCLISEVEQEDKNVLVDRMREEDAESEVLALRYYRRCGICSTENPPQRAAFALCGHIACLPCVEKLVDSSGNVTCPHCKKSSAYKALYEDETTDDISEPAQMSKRVGKIKLDYKQNRKLSRGFWAAVMIVCFVGLIIHDYRKSRETVKPSKPKDDRYHGQGVDMILYNSLDQLMASVPHSRWAYWNCHATMGREALENLKRKAQRHYGVAIVLSLRLEQALDEKMPSLDGDALDFARKVSLEALNYYSIFVAGQPLPRGSLKESVLNAVNKYKDLSGAQKTNLKQAYPSVAWIFNSEKFRKFCNVLFGDEEIVDSLLN